MHRLRMHAAIHPLAQMSCLSTSDNFTLKLSPIHLTRKYLLLSMNKTHNNIVIHSEYSHTNSLSHKTLDSALFNVTLGSYLFLKLSRHL